MPRNVGQMVELAELRKDSPPWEHAPKVSERCANACPTDGRCHKPIPRAARRNARPPHGGRARGRNVDRASFIW